MKRNKRTRAALLASLLAFGYLMAVIPLPVSAANPVINQNKYCTFSNVHTCVNGTPLAVTTSGDIIVVVIAFQNLGTLDASPITSITDGQSLSYTAVAPCYQAYIPSQTRYGGVCIYTATTASTASKTITVTFAQTTHYYGFSAFLDVSNLNNAGADPTTVRTGACTSGSQTCGNVASVSSAVPFTMSSGQLAIAAEYLNFPDSPLTSADANHALLEAASNSAYEGIYATAQAASPTVFPITVSNGAGNPHMNAYVSTGVIIGSVAAAGIVTVIGPCSFFQLQCWLIPMFYMGAFSGFFVGVGAAFEVSEKSFLYLLLTGATFASLVEIQLGIMTPMVPVMLIAANIAYSFRLDKLIYGALTRTSK